MKLFHFSFPVTLLFLLLLGCISQYPYKPCTIASKPSKQRTAYPPRNKPYRTHIVTKGETLWHISQQYHVSIHDLISINHIKDPSHLIAGTRLIIPRRNIAETEKKSSFSSAQKVATYKEGFIWPVRGKVIIFFGKTKSEISKGIVIKAPLGARIKASKSGKVIYSGSYGPFGNTVILQHPHGFSTVYTYNKKNLVKRGQWVSQGQTIATVGASGRVSSPCLHFEIRKESKAVDPLIYLGNPGHGKR